MLHAFHIVNQHHQHCINWGITHFFYLNLYQSFQERVKRVQYFADMLFAGLPPENEP
jgi:hypothetical protein